MRLLQLNPNGNEQSALDFHPMVTVVTGLTPAGRGRIVDAVSALPRGTNPGCFGLLEAHGILLDLNVDTLEILGLEGDLDVVVGPGDIPGGSDRVEGGALDSVLPSGLAPVDLDDFIAVTPRGRYPELDDARDRVDQATEAVAMLREAVARAREAHAEAAARARAAEAALDAVTSAPASADLHLVTDTDTDTGVIGEFTGDDVDFVLQGEADGFLEDATLEPEDLGGLEGFDDGEPPPPPSDAFAGVGLLSGATPASSFDAEIDEDFDRGADALYDLVADDTSPWASGADAPADGARDAAGDAAGDSGEVDPIERRLELEVRTEELNETIARVDRGIDELAAVDSRPIQVLVDAIKNPGPVEFVPSRRGNELADEFVRLQGEVAVLEEGLEARGMDTASAMNRLEAAREAAAKAEKAMRPPEYTEQDRAELEAAHDAVLEAQSAGRRGKKKLDEALALEQSILDRMGFPTWSAYVMGAGLMTIDPAAEHRLELARNELDEAEQHWSNVTAMIEADPVHRELLDRLEAVYLEAFDMLGGDDETDDLESKLRNLLEEKRELTTEELLEALLYQLEIVGIQLPPEMADIDRAVLVAEAFLEEAKAIIDRLNELGEEKVAALEELERIEDELDELPTEEEWEAELAARAAAAEADRLAAEEADRLAAEEAERAAAEEAERAAAEEAERAAAEEAERLEAERAAADAAAVAEEEAAERAAREAELASAPQVSDEELAELEKEYEIAAEEEADYVELVEAREALLEAAEQVEVTAHSQLREIAGRLAQADAEADAGDASPEQDNGQLHAGTDTAFADISGVDAGAEAVEFFLLARLAALRTASYAGSVPLLIDDALAGRPRKSVEQLLHKLERMSESVQIIYLSDDETVTRWAEGVGFDRAAVVVAPPTFV